MEDQYYYTHNLVQQNSHNTYLKNLLLLPIFGQRVSCKKSSVRLQQSLEGAYVSLRRISRTTEHIDPLVILCVFTLHLHENDQKR